MYDVPGHNGNARTYQYLKLLCYWEGLQKDIHTLVKQCIMCRQHNLCPQHYVQLHVEVLSMPMYFIVMDVMGRFKPSPQGH